MLGTVDAFLHAANANVVAFTENGEIRGKRTSALSFQDASSFVSVQIGMLETDQIHAVRHRVNAHNAAIVA